MYVTEDPKVPQVNALLTEMAADCLVQSDAKIGLQAPVYLDAQGGSGHKHKDATFMSLRPKGDDRNYTACKILVSRWSCGPL